MRLKELFPEEDWSFIEQLKEGPIDDIQYIPKKSWEIETDASGRKSYPKSSSYAQHDKIRLHHALHAKKLIHRFRKSIPKFSIVALDTENIRLRIGVERGMVDLEELKAIVNHSIRIRLVSGGDNEVIDIAENEDVIKIYVDKVNFIITQNKYGARDQLSPDIVAHRLAHALLPQWSPNEDTQLLKIPEHIRNTLDLLSDMYTVNGYGPDMIADLGTRAAFKVVWLESSEAWLELFVGYLLDNQVPILDHLKPALADCYGTDDPRRYPERSQNATRYFTKDVKKANELLEILRADIAEFFDSLFPKLVGKIFMF